MPLSCAGKIGSSVGEICLSGLLSPRKVINFAVLGCTGDFGSSSGSCEGISTASEARCPSPESSSQSDTPPATSQWVEDATLLVTRFEYANFFHTVTDWYSAYVASRVTGLPNRPHLVFVDGHCKTQLEETWRAMFSSLRYAKNFTGPVCFRHVILSPLGYETALFKGLTETINCQGAPAHELWENPDNRKTARLSEFGEMLKAAFHLPLNKGRVIKPVSGHNILFVRREDYLAHPRHAGKVESRLSNEQEVYDSLKSWVSNHLECKIKLVNGLFAHMSMKEQIHAIQDASIIIGAHGAGLTHIISARPKTIILEIISSQYRRPHFALIAKWKGLEYNAINLHGSSANPSEVIDMVSSILRTLGC
ncbi:beta-1,2-xylosyltransferase isoform X3 [Tasmannia lanceolata]|uniref:beta-1,2-xylosyltransferase isoform X3 n=1 Tax=Tasmannia lanceolata TaxID=3420 RepID=UPI004064A5D1